MKTLTFDKEESFLRGHIPLQKFKKLLESTNWAGLEEVQFTGNGFCTDQVINTIRLAKKGTLSSLQRVDLQGCSLLTDVGVKWLTEILTGASKLREVSLDGCSLVSDAGLAQLVGVLPDDCHVSVIGTSVCRLTSARDKTIRASAGSTFPPNEATADFKNGGVLVVSHPSIKSSIAYTLNGKTGVPRTELDHVALHLKDGWNININEIAVQDPLFDVLVKTKPLQVVVPFDSSADINDVSKHVTDVISRVLMKEPDYPSIELGKPADDPFAGSLKAKDQFMDIKFVTGHQLNVENSVLENLPVTEEEKEVDGCFLSRAFFTKSHPFFQVQFLSKDDAVEEGAGGGLPDELLIGCVRDLYYVKMSPKPWKEQDRISGNESKNLLVHRFSLANVKKGDTFGFGIYGDWESEFIAGPSCRLYVSLNGTEVKYEGNQEDASFGRIYHPCVAINSHFICQFKMPHLLSPPKELIDVYKKEKRWIRTCFNTYCVISSTGIISSNKNEGRSSEGYFVSEQSVGTKDTPYTSFSLRPVEDSGDCSIVFGITFGGYTLNSDSRYVMFFGTNGQVKIRNGDDIVNLVDAPAKLTTGDEVTFQWEIEKQPITFHDTKECPVRVLRNGKLICETSYPFHFRGGRPLENVFINLTSPKPGFERRVQLLNYQPPYRAPVTRKSNVTLAVQRSMQVYDDGVIVCSPEGSCPYMISGTPINSQLTYFEMEIVGFSPNTCDVGIGLTHSLSDTTDMIGKSRHEIQYLIARNTKLGRIWTDAIKSSDASFYAEQGDVLGCGVRASFRDDGSLMENQEVQVYFTKNGKEIDYKHTMVCRSEGLYPLFTLYSKEAVLRIRGFNPNSTFNNFVFPRKEQNATTFPGCVFTVLDVSGDGKAAALKTKLPLDKLPCAQKFKDHIKTLERDLDGLNLENQQRLSELNRAVENLDRLAKSPDRVTFLSAKLSTKEGVEASKTSILNSFQSHRDQQRALYTLPQTLVKVVEVIREELRKQGICHVVESHSDNLSCPSLYESIKPVSPKYLTGEMFLKLVELLSQQGELLCIQTNCGLLAVDLEFAGKSTETLLNFSKLEKVPAGISAIGEKSTVCKIVIKDPVMDGMVLDFLQNYKGLMKLPVTWRTDTKEDNFVYTLLKNLDPPKFTLSEFVSREKAVKDCVLIQRTYSFPAVFPQQLLPLVLSAINDYGNPLLISPEGGVIISGVVQTIVREEPVNGTKVLMIESRCYLPQTKSPAVNDDTEKSVREYTLHVFCIVADLTDRIIKRLGLVAVISQNIPVNSVNVSLGCAHKWIPLPDTEHIQSVCTLCNMCCEKGELCPYNRIMGTDLRKCGCKTQTPGCVDCGICVACVKKLWNLRTELRPMAMSLTSSSEIHGVTLNPVTFNEVEIDVVSGMCPPLCLSTEGRIVLAAPGLGRTFSNKIGFSDIRLGLDYNKDLRLCVLQGDRLKIRLSAPQGAVTHSADQGNTSTIVPKFVQYYTEICRGAVALQEAGIVCFKTSSKNVAQFVAPKPFSETLRRFSIKILCGGSKCSVGVGLCPKAYGSGNMPGWKSYSYGYHADDGKIYTEKGSSQIVTEKCMVGDVMAVDYDVKSHELIFFKNDQEMYKMTVPDNGKPMPVFYPIIGLHSDYECVKLQEKDPWSPLDQNVKHEVPPSLDFIKAEGLLISPTKTLVMPKYFSALCTGQIILHNTTKTPLGYKLEPANIFKAREAEGGEDHSLGIIKENETKVILCHAEEKTCKISDVIIGWIELQKNKTYSSGELQKAFTKKHHNYRLKAHMKHVDYNKGLTRVNKGDKRKDYILEVFKNSELMERYWIGPYNYTLYIPYNLGQYLLRYPRCPSFNFPPHLEKGMKVFITLPSHAVAEAVITGVEHSGKYQLEYSPEGDRDNTIITGDQSLMEVVGHKEGDPVLMYKADASQKNLTQTYMYAPPHLVPKGSAEVLKQTDTKWLSLLLTHGASCFSNIYRPTVQEQMMVIQSRNLIGWLDGYGANGAVEDTFAFLPNSLNTETFLFPSVGMFGKLNVHRLCFYADQLIHYQTQKKIHLRDPLHLMNMEALTPKSDPSPEVTLACKFQGWVYIALIAKKLVLPSQHTSLLPEKDLDGFSSSQMEHFLYALVHQFATLSSLYASQYGGLQNQSNPVSGTKRVLELIEGQGQPLIKYKGELITDPSNLIQHGSLCICKAHKVSMATNDSDLQSDLEVTYDLLDPYTLNVNAVNWDITRKIKLPKDFFQRIFNLEHFSISGCHFEEKTTLPLHSASLKELRYLDVNYAKVTELPSDVLKANDLREARLMGMSLGKISATFFARKSNAYVITKLELIGLNLTELPTEIKNLAVLQELNLDHNPLTKLPAGLKELRKLQVLSIQGFPLMNFDGDVDSLTRQQYRTWHKENPSITNYLSMEVVESMFDEADQKKRGVLSVSEIAQLNLKLFFQLPRIGTDGSNENYGGFPNIIISLTQLQELYFGCQGITRVPSELKALTKLRVIDLQHCPLLETLSSKFGFLKELKNINLRHCPSLRTPPHEVVSRGFSSVKAYLKRLDGGFTTCRRTKLMFVGLGDAGKTSLLKALTSSSKKTSGTQNAQLTDGIEIKSWKVTAPDKGEITYSAWDFAGQTVYYNTHQFFLTSRAVYLLLWNMRMGFEHAGLDFWLSSIACHAPDAPVLIIGTQVDQIPMPDIEEKVIRTTYPQIQGFHYVSSIVGTGIKELEKDLIEITMQQPYLEEKIPQVWLNLEAKMLQLRKGRSILDFEEVEEIAREEGIYHEQDLKEAIAFLDNLGTIQYFDTDFLRNKVVVDPQWIVNVMACVVSVRASVIQKNDGRFEHNQLDTVWEKYPQDLRPWLLSLTEEFDLTFPLPGQPLNVVPCLLPLAPPEEFQWPDLDPADDVLENKIVYKFVYLPGGLFNRLQVRLFNFSDGKMIWKKGSFLQKNQHLALIQQDNDSQLTVTVQGPRPENVLFLIHEVLESLITESYHGVTYDYYLPCPDCINKGSDSWRDPYLFRASIVRKGKNMNAPFLQCTQNFHTVAMTQLLAIMPDDRNSDFDIHLQNSISALQSINNDIEFDVSVVYCQADVPPNGKKDLIDPREVKKDLLSWNYNVWMPETVTPDRVSEMTLQLKNSKVVVCCMSDQFEKDETCHNMFLYITNQLRKKALIVVVRPSMNWQDTDLGMKIGDAFVCMIRTPDRYKSKIVDLKDMVDKSLIAMDKNKQKPADVFVSYCWQNSRHAVSKGTKIQNTRSLGEVDPRDIKDYLTEKKVSCWIDIERIGTYGLYLDIAMGLQSCKLIVCCVSDEYADSENCMMELKYAVLNLRLPLILVPVGSGNRWKSKVGIFVMKCDGEAPEVSMQTTDNRDVLLATVREMLASQNQKEDVIKAKQREEKERQRSLEKKAQDLKFSYQEEYELLQRKFLRHVTLITTKLNFEFLPRLLVFDFVKAGSVGVSSDSGKPRRPRTGKERRKAVILEDEEEDWQGEEFCVKVMCEHEEGWHVSERSLNLSARTSEEVCQVIREAAPYLSRLYAVLKQSAMNLNCLRGKTGDSYCSYIDKKGFEETNFGKAYEAIYHFVADHASKRDLTQKLHRCHLPSGKILWLCDNHSNGSRITKLSKGVTSSRGAGIVTLTREDDLLKEHMRRHPTVLKLLKRPEPEESDDVEEEEKKESEDNEESGEEEEMGDQEPVEEKPSNELEVNVQYRETNRNLASRSGPVNRGGSPAPSKGGLDERQAGRRKEPSNVTDGRNEKLVKEQPVKEDQKAKQNTDKEGQKADKLGQKTVNAERKSDNRKPVAPTNAGAKGEKKESSVCVMS